MELEELKTLWRETDRRVGSLESAHRLTQRRARTDTLDRARAKLRWVTPVLWYELAVGVLVALLVGSYLADHLGVARFAIPALALHLGALATIGFAAWQLVALVQIDHAGPVVTIQRRLAELARMRARARRWLLLSAPLLWALLIVVVPHGLFGLDPYRAFGMSWIAVNLLFGLVVLAAAAWACWRFPDRADRSRVLRALGSDLTGRRLAAASGFLEEIAEFEGED